MLVDDPKDRPDEDDDVELDDTETAEEETEDESPEGEPADGEGDREPDDEAEEREEAEETVTLRRSEYDRMTRGEGRRQPPTERPDPLAESYAEMLRDEKVPLSVKKVVHGLAQRTVQAEDRASRAERVARELGAIPAKHRDRVDHLVDQFGLTPKIAHQLVKGELYDRLVEKKRSRREGGGRGEEREEREPARRPASQRGSALHTSTTRAVRSEPDTSRNGQTIRVKSHPNLKIPLEFPTSTAYEKFMDGLGDDEKRVVLGVRRNGLGAKIRGHS